jgi:hypothetical protein
MGDSKRVTLWWLPEGYYRVARLFIMSGRRISGRILFSDDFPTPPAVYGSVTR